MEVSSAGDGAEVAVDAEALGPSDSGHGATMASQTQLVPGSDDEKDDDDSGDEGDEGGESDGATNENADASAAADATDDAQVSAVVDDADKAGIAAEEAHGAQAQEAQAVVERPKRPKSSYMHFTVACRAEVQQAHPDAKGVAAIAKLLGEKWRTLSDEDKTPYAASAAAEKAAYVELMEAWQAAGGKHQGAAAQAGDEEAPRRSSELALPLARVARLMKMDAGVRAVSKEAKVAIAKATELFLEFAVESVFTFSRTGSKSKTLSYGQFRDCVMRGPPQLEFLDADFPKPVQKPKPVRNAASKRASAPQDGEGAPPEAAGAQKLKKRKVADAPPALPAPNGMGSYFAAAANKTTKPKAVAPEVAATAAAIREV